VKLLRLAVCIASLALSLDAADATGIWTGQLPGRNGTSQDITFKFIQKDNTLSGKLYGDFLSTPFSGGKIDGSQVTFTISTREQVGNLFNDVKHVFTGTFDGTEFHLTRERQGPAGEVVDPRNRAPSRALRSSASSNLVDSEPNQAEVWAP
jgi:hypothetical protein